MAASREVNLEKISIKVWLAKRAFPWSMRGQRHSKIRKQPRPYYKPINSIPFDASNILTGRCQWTGGTWYPIKIPIGNSGSFKRNFVLYSTIRLPPPRCLAQLSEQHKTSDDFNDCKGGTSRSAPQDRAK